MKMLLKRGFVFFTGFMGSVIMFAQGIRISDNSGIPDPSAMLDIISTSKGVLMPRLTESERDAIADPADGLLLFNTSSGCFNFWFANSWFEWCGKCIPVNEINLQPLSQTVCINSNVQFSSGGYGNGLTYQWQLSTDNGSSWNDISNSITYSGAQMATLTVNNVPETFNNYQYRLRIVGICSDDISDAATLTILDTPTGVTAGTDQSEVICTTTLEGSDPGSNTGEWTIQSGSGGSFGNSSAHNSTFTGSGIYLLRWTVSNTCFSTYDEVTISMTGKQIFTYTGDYQTFAVPSCVSTIFVKMWGAGGGGNNANGGAGGYTDGYISVTPGQQFKILVGGGGDLNHTVGTYEFGGGGWTYPDGGNGGGSGGGRTSLRDISNTIDLMTAGGGGGGGYMGGNDNFGGAGGGTNGALGSGSGSGAGGTQSSGGSGGTGNGGTAQSGSQYQGGSNTSGWAGGGGGGGYFGGGGASGVSGDHGGAGGGSGYIGGASVFNAQTLQGSGATPPMTGDADYLSGTATGGTPNGGNGRVIISW
ncbi:MAG: hypothetical protein IT223_10380 [Crocinitomicaceae bacterium]|nr:hypothetical protein [Crocinitomicaceae bacterium]